MELFDSSNGTRGGQLQVTWPGDGGGTHLQHGGSQQRLSEMHSARLPLTKSRGTGFSWQRKPVSAPRPGQRDGGFGLLRPRLWPSTVPRVGTLGRGTQSLGQSCLVLSQASRAWHLRGSGQRGLGPGFKASEGKGTVAGSRAPRAGVQARLGRQGKEEAMPATDMAKREKS